MIRDSWGLGCGSGVWIGPGCRYGVRAGGFDELEGDGTARGGLLLRAACAGWILPTRMVRGRPGDLASTRTYEASRSTVCVGMFGQSPDGQTMMSRSGSGPSYIFLDEGQPAQRKALEASRSDDAAGCLGSHETFWVPITRTVEGNEHKVRIGDYETFSAHLSRGMGGATSRQPAGRIRSTRSISRARRRPCTTGTVRGTSTGRTRTTCSRASASTARNTRNSCR